MLLDDVLDPPLLQKLGLVFFHVENDLGASAQWLSVIGPDGEGTASGGLPDVLLVVVVVIR